MKKYVKIKSFLQNVVGVVPLQNIHEPLFEHWMLLGLKTLNIRSLKQMQIFQTSFQNYTAPLPENFESIIAVALCIDGTRTQLALPASKIIPKFNPNCLTCQPEYFISNNKVNFNAERGDAIIVYFGFPTDEEGDILVPDDGTLAEALFHFVMYRYYLSKVVGEEDLKYQQLAEKHYANWSTLSKKAHNLDLPDLGELENIKRLVHKTMPQDLWHRMFTTLNIYENSRF